MAVRERLLTGATELFTRKGYAATTVREIVAAAGVTKPVLYYYFRNKEGIYLELIRGAFAKFEPFSMLPVKSREAPPRSYCASRIRYSPSSWKTSRWQD